MKPADIKSNTFIDSSKEIISDLNVEKIVGTFYEKELLNTIKVELDSAKLKNIPSHLSSLKNKVDKLDIRKLETTPVDLSKLSNLVKNDVVTKTEHNVIC